MGRTIRWIGALLLLCLCSSPQGALAAGVDLRRDVCTAVLPDEAPDAVVNSAPYRCGPDAATQGAGWVWLRLDHRRLKSLPAHWHLLVDQTRFDRIAVLLQDTNGFQRSTKTQAELKDHWAPGGLLKFVIDTPGRDVRTLHLGFRRLADLSLMRKIVAVPSSAQVMADARWLLLMGLFAGTLFSALL